MATPLTSEEQDKYTRLIDSILAMADLKTISRKRVRQGLETALGKDLSSQKDAIKSLIEARFDAISTNAVQTPPSPEDAKPEPPPSSSEANGDDEGGRASPEVKSRSVRKRDYSQSVEDADARLAAELQADEDRMARGRATRKGGGGAAAGKKVKARKQKSEKAVRASDDGDVDGDGPPKKRRAGGGFQQEFNLSYTLADVVGVSKLSRPQVVKKLWEHIKAHDLQDPKNRRQIICDGKMLAVFKQPRVDMFQMNKLIGSHLYPTEEE